MFKTFYCDECGDDKNWPRQINTVKGWCQICGVETLGNDTPTSMLPQDKPHPRQMHFNFEHYTRKDE